MNPLYSMVNGQTQQAQSFDGLRFSSPMMQFGYLMQAINNPVAFVQKAIPDLPPQIANNPNQILRYLQQTRGITDDQINQAASMIPRY